MKYYVYTHTSNKTGKIFYVGNGSGRRAYSKSSRNKHWHAISNSHGYSIKIILKFNKKECAFSIEKALISFIDIENLVNVTRGGDGGIGTKPGTSHPMYGRTGSNHPRFGTMHDDEARRNISSGRKNGKNNCLTKEGRKNLSEAMIGNNHASGYHHSNEMKLHLSEKLSGRKNPSYISDVYNFSHNSGELFSGTPRDFCIKYCLHRGNVSSMISGRLNIVKGWKIRPVWEL